MRYFYSHLSNLERYLTPLEFLEKSIDLYLPALEAPFDYHYATVLGYASITFRVRACQDVKVFLSEVVGRDDTAAPVVRLHHNVCLTAKLTRIYILNFYLSRLNMRICEVVPCGQMRIARKNYSLINNVLTSRRIHNSL